MAKLELRIKGSNYKSVEEYVLALLAESIWDSQSYSKEEEKEIKKRLASLGYE